MADAGPDLSQIMPMLQQLITAMSSGQMPGGSAGGYQARGATFNNAASGFSIGGALGGGGLGLGADLMLQTLLPSDLLGRLQSSAGINAGQRTQSMLQRQAMMEINVLGGGQEMARNLGIDPTKDPGAFNTVATMSGIFGQMSPMMRQAMYATTPTAMFTGGQNIVNAMQLMNPMSDIRAGQATAINEAFHRLGTNGTGLLNTRFTHGMNLDDLAQVAEFTADMGDSANDLDITERRAAHRKRLTEGKYKGPLSADQSAALEADITEGVNADRLTTGASYNAQVAKATRSFMGPNATTGDALNMMRELGMSAQSKTEAINLEELVRNLEALGKQAGMTTQDMVNAGRVLTAQNGGSLTYNMAIAGQAQAAERLMSMDARAKGLDTNAAAASVITNTAQAQSDAQGHGSVSRALAALYVTDAAARDEMGVNAQAKDGKAQIALANEVLYGTTARGRAAGGVFSMSDERLGAVNNEMFQKYKLNLLDTNANIALESTLGSLGSYEKPFGSLLRNKDFQRALAENQQRNLSYDDAAKQFGITGDRYTQLVQFLGTDTVGQAYTTAVSRSYKQDRLAQDRTDRVDEQKAISDIDDITKAGGAGQGIFQGFKHGSVTDFESALVAAGFAVPGARMAVEQAAGRSASYRKKFVDAISGKHEAVANMLGSHTVEEGEKYQAQIAEFDDQLKDLNFTEKEDDQTKGFNKTGHEILAKRQRDVSGTAPSKDKDKTVSNGNTSPAGTVTIDGKMVLTVLAPDGTPYPDDKWSIAAMGTPGQFQIVKGGK